MSGLQGVGAGRRIGLCVGAAAISMAAGCGFLVLMAQRQKAAEQQHKGQDPRNTALPDARHTQQVRLSRSNVNRGCIESSTLTKPVGNPNTKNIRVSLAK